MIIVICCVCHARVRTIPCPASQDGLISHGYCPMHAAAALASIGRTCLAVNRPRAALAFPTWDPGL